MKVQTVNQSIDEQLIDAAGAHNLALVKQLVSKGANVNYIRHTDVNGWYSGNTHTALYTAVHADFKGDQKNYVDVLEFLLQKGADAKFQARRGGWNHCTNYPLFSGVAYTINKFTTTEQKIRFLKIFADRGVQINQTESHSRSKNWRGYSTRTCFIFQMMDACGMRSKIGQLTRLASNVNFEKLESEKYNQLLKQFKKQNPGYNNQLGEYEQVQKEQKQEEEQQNKKQKQKVPQVDLIKALIDFGADANSSRMQNFWQNYENDYYEDGDYGVFAKYDEKRTNIYETVLHRVIMYDLPELIEYLIAKGAKIETKCKFTIQRANYPNEWPEQIKERRKNKVNAQLLKKQKQKCEHQKQLQQAQTEQQKNNIRRRLAFCQFQIFKCKRFAIENQCPIGLHQDREINCVQIAEQLKISQKTIDILKEKMKDVKSK